jgi:hypothetical protein
VHAAGSIALTQSSLHVKNNPRHKEKTAKRMEFVDRIRYKNYSTNVSKIKLGYGFLLQLNQNNVQF